MHGTGVCVVISRLVWGLTATREPPSARLSERVREWRDVSLLTCLQWPWCWPWSYPCPRWLATTALKLAIYLIDSLSLSLYPTERVWIKLSSNAMSIHSSPHCTQCRPGQATLLPACLPRIRSQLHSAYCRCGGGGVSTRVQDERNSELTEQQC